MADDQDLLRRWVAAINAHDVSTIASLMAPDFVFVDSLGNEVVGATKMTPGWQGYFAMCPDYWIRVRDVAAMAARGRTGGGWPEKPVERSTARRGEYLPRGRS